MWVLAVFLVATTGFTAGEEWSYDFETKWPGVCTTGTQQSPINIMSSDAIVDRQETHIKGPLVFRGFGSVNVTGANTGHTLKWTLEEDEPSPIISGGPLRGNYSFIQFHLHWLSEHAIDGMKYPMEIHLVHMKTGLTAEEAVERPDGLAVIGILCQVHSGEESEFALGEIEPALPNLTKRSVSSVPPTVLDLTRLFSPNMQSFYSYHGSLTTPDCQEVVTWMVMDKPLIISDTQYKLFSKVDVGGIDNYRSLQAINRVIYRSIASSASVFFPSTLALLASLFHLSSSMTSVLSKGVCTAVNIKKKLFGHPVKECKSN